MAGTNHLLHNRGPVWSADPRRVVVERLPEVLEGVQILHTESVETVGMSQPLKFWRLKL